MIRSSPNDIPWGQLTMKIIQLISLLLTLILAAAWSSNGIHFTNLAQIDLSQAQAFEFLIVISIFAIIWPVASIIIYLVKQDLPAIVVLIVTSVLAFFVVISVSVFAAAVYNLSSTDAARALNLNVAALEAACFFGVVSALGYIGDLVLEMLALAFGIRRSGISKLYLGSCCEGKAE